MDEQTVTIEAPPFPPPAPPPSAPKPQWYQLPVSRDPDDHKVGGVIGGLSRTYGFDVRTTRIAVLIATIVLPVIIVLYIAAWLLLPARPAEAVSLEHIARDRRRVPLYIAIGLVLVAGGVGSFGSWFFLGGVPWGLGLVAVGVLLWVAPGLTKSAHSTFASSGTAAPPPPPGDGTTTPTPTTVMTATAATDAPTSTIPLPSASATPATPWIAGRPLQMDDVRPRRKRRPVASLVTLAVLAFIGIAAAGDAMDWWDIPVLTTVVISLIGTAVGAVVSAIVNRSWLALPIVPLLAVVTTGLLLTQPHLGGGTGERTVTPRTVAAAERHQQLGLGELTIDLTEVPLGTETVDVRAEVGYGHMRIVVPKDATIVVDSEIGAGDVLLDGQTVTDGFRDSDQRTLQPVGTSAGTINLDVEIGGGRIDIERAL